MHGAKRVRVEWSGAEGISNEERDRAQAELQALRDACQRLRSMRVECEQSEAERRCRVSCRCADGARGLRVVRRSFAEALRDFARLLHARCRP